MAEGRGGQTGEMFRPEMFRQTDCYYEATRLSGIKNDEQTIRDIIAQQEIAWIAGDANAYGARFHPDGTFTNIFGNRYIGREAFIDRHARVFTTIGKGSKSTYDVKRIHFPVPGTAIVDIDYAWTGYGPLPHGFAPQPDGTLRTSLLEVLVKDQNGWWIVAYHNGDVIEGSAR